MHLPNYLQRISYVQPLSVTEETLFGLHRAHVLSVPFENLDVINKVPITLDQDLFCHKIIDKGRGGFW